MDITDIKKIWEDVKAELRKVIPEHTFETWFEPLQATGYEDNTFSILTVHALAVEIIRRNHYSEIKSALEKIVGKPTEFTITFDADLAKKYEKEKQKEYKREKTKLIDEFAHKIKSINNLTQMQSFSNLNLKYKFENYVVGENNRPAYSIAYSVAQNPGGKFNPLFIYGASGLGKTHLIQAIGHYIVFNKPDLKVRYVKTEEYVNELINNLRQGNDKNSRMEKFRQKYRNIDVLLMDDIQFLESKNYTMEELFHTFDALHNHNKQIVITSDRLPKDIPTLTDRLRTRFEMGIVVDITPPDFETRVAIIKNLAEQNMVKMEFDVCEYVANNFVNNVRELEGAFNKVSAFADIEKTEITLDFAKQVLKCEENKKSITLNDVAQKVANYYDVTVDDFKSPARSQKISNARQIAVYLSRELTGKSFETIAEFFDKKHPTMLYSHGKIQDELKTDNLLQKEINELKKKIKG